MRSTSRGAALTFLAGLVLLLAATCAQAQRSLECQRVWVEASSDNSMIECVTDTSRLGSQWRYYIWTGVAVVIFLFAIFGLLIIFVCRCCNCCGCCQGCVNPKEPETRRRARCTLWMWIVFVILWACCVCVLIIYGSSMMMGSASNLLDNLEDGTLGYFVDTKDNITELLTDYSTVPPTKPIIDLSSIDDVVRQLRDSIHTVRDDYFKYFKIARIVSYCVGAVGVVLALLILIFAFCRCNGCCCPVLFSGLYFFFALIFALLAIVFTALWYVATAACGEVTLQYKREPGVFQWYLVPWCESQFNFENLRKDVLSEVSKGSHDACAELLGFCDPTNPVYDYATEPTKIFMCGSLNGSPITNANSCTKLDDVVSVVTTSYAKPMISNTLCTNTTGWQYQEKCTIVECATRCRNYETPDIEARTWSQTIISATDFAVNASAALSYATPLLQCNFIIDKLAASLEVPEHATGFQLTSNSNNVCTDLHVSVIMVACGFFVGSLMFIMGIYVLHRGSWIWASLPDEK